MNPCVNLPKTSPIALLRSNVFPSYDSRNTSPIDLDYLALKLSVRSCFVIQDMGYGIYGASLSINSK